MVPALHGQERVQLVKRGHVDYLHLQVQDIQLLDKVNQVQWLLEVHDDRMGAAGAPLAATARRNRRGREAAPSAGRNPRAGGGRRSARGARQGPPTPRSSPRRPGRDPRRRPHAWAGAGVSPRAAIGGGHSHARAYIFASGSWCESCIRGRGCDAAHYDQQGHTVDAVVPVLQFDYYFATGSGESQIGPAGSGSPQIGLIGVVRSTGMTVACGCESKGVDRAYPIQTAVACIQELGHRLIIIQTDGEPAILALSDVRKRLFRPDFAPGQSLRERPEQGRSGVSDRHGRTPCESVHGFPQPNDGRQVRFALSSDTQHGSTTGSTIPETFG